MLSSFPTLARGLQNSLIQYIIEEQLYNIF